jgi:integrase
MKLKWKAVVTTKPQPGATIDIPDPAVYAPGQYMLRYRVRPSGRIFAQLRYKRDGKWEAAAIAPVPMTEDEARVAEQAYRESPLSNSGRLADRYPLLYTPDRGLDPIRHKAKMMLPGLLAGPGPEKATLRALIDDYLRHVVADQRKRTQEERRRYLLRDWAPFHEHAASALTREEIAAHLLKLKADHGGVAANRSRATLHAMYRWAEGIGRIATIPAFPPKVLKIEPSRDRVLSLRELRAIWAAAEAMGEYGIIVRLLMLTGQRRSEVSGMRWSELDLDRALWVLPGARTKNKQAHQVPLARQAVALLEGRQRPKGRELVFGQEDGAFGGWSRCKGRLDALCGFSDWTLHDLRRSFVTHLAELGIAPHVIEAAVNHQSGHKGGVAGIYNRAVYAPEKAKAMQQWADHLMS